MNSCSFWGQGRNMWNKWLIQSEGRVFLSFCLNPRVFATQLKFGKWNLIKIRGVLCWKFQVVHGELQLWQLQYWKILYSSKIAANWKWMGMKHAFKFISNVNAEQFMLWRVKRKVKISKFPEYFCLTWGEMESCSLTQCYYLLSCSPSLQ